MEQGMHRFIRSGVRGAIDRLALATYVPDMAVLAGWIEP
jgi:hypothetical protein